METKFFAMMQLLGNQSFNRAMLGITVIQSRVNARMVVTLRQRIGGERVWLSPSFSSRSTIE